MSVPRKEVLVFVDGQEIARHILGPGAHTFGTWEACSIRIQAERVSPQHARLTVGEDGSLLLEDLASTNGTFLDGQTVHAPTPVTRNQTIQIGAAQILVLQHTLGAFEASTVTADGPGNGDTTPELSPSPRYQLGPEIAKGGMGVVESASFSPDGTHIVTASADSTARVWGATTGKPLGEPMHHEDGVVSASFSPDGTRILTTDTDGARMVWDVQGPVRAPNIYDVLEDANRAFTPRSTRIVTASSNNTARLWNVGSMLHLASQTPEWVCEWARAFAGLRFDADGEIKTMAAEEQIELLYAPHEGNDPWSRLARWLATEPAQRTIDPDSKVTCREIAERARDFGSKESLESALRYDTTAPLARLMLAKFEDNPERAAFLRDYDLKRLPDDPVLWERAVRSLHEQKDDARAGQALRKLEKLAPEKAAALRKELGL